MDVLGIDNIKQLLKVGLNLASKATKALEDQKISFFEAVGMVPDVFATIGVAKSWRDVQKELNDLTDEEKQQIADFVKDQFDIPNEKVETFVQHALMQVISLNELINEFKNLNK